VRIANWTAEGFAAMWRNIWARRQEEEERRRIEHADKIKHALIVLEALRSMKLEPSKSQAQRAFF